MSRVIVIGGSMSGLLAARVLSERFDEVVVYERDRYPGSPSARRGVPQGQHVHLLLRRGMEILDQLFPGLIDELQDAGAHAVNFGAELAILTYWGWRQQYPSETFMLTMTRPLLEWHVLQRVRRQPNVRIVEGTDVVGLVADPTGTQVTGIRLAGRQTVPGAEKSSANLIVVANGRSSQLPAWLTELGYPAPQATEIDSLTGYASAFFSEPEAFPRDWKALLLTGLPPDMRRVGTILPVEEKRWLVTLMGIGGDYPPTDADGFYAFARSLRSPVLARAIESAERLSPIRGNRSTKNIRHHYHALARWPEGLIVVGDAACAFNPIYGQGMSVAAMEAMALRDSLGRWRGRRPDGDLGGLARYCQRQLYRVVQTPWLMATGEDLRWPTTVGAHADFVTKLFHRYYDHILALTTTDHRVDRTFLEVAHLTRSPMSLFHPSILVRVLVNVLRPSRSMSEQLAAAELQPAAIE